MPDRAIPSLSRARGMTCILINLTATPGLGSLMARRFFAGAGQLILALAGFVLILIWMLKLFSRMFRAELGESSAANIPDWLWKWGAILFVAGWLWSLVTSFSLWRRIVAEEKARAESVPPRLADLTGGPDQMNLK